MLADHPPVMCRLREEILHVLGPEETPTFEHIREMKYLRAVINGEALRRFRVDRRLGDDPDLLETLRLYPPV